MTTKTRPQTIKQLAAQHGCSEDTISQWRAEGAPLNDHAAMEEWKAEKRSGPTAGEPECLKAARLRKTVLEADRLQVKYDQERKASVPMSVVEPWLMSLAATVESAFDVIIADAPNWTGMTPAKAQARAQEVKRRIVAAFHEAPRKLLSAA